MRPSDYQEYTPPKDASTRRLLRERGTLRCEWCNKRTEVRPGFRWGGIDLEEWRSFVAEHTPFFCKRDSCIAHRRELMGRPRQAPKDPTPRRQRRRGSDDQG